jgi:hypothetical protein
MAGCRSLCDNAYIGGSWHVMPSVPEEVRAAREFRRSGPGWCTANMDSHTFVKQTKLISVWPNIGYRDQGCDSQGL